MTMKPGITQSVAIPRRGEITEIVGRLSSGRTSLVLTWLAEVTGRGGAVALVDTDDTFDPSSGARAGVELCRLLWVRCARHRRTALTATDLLVRCPGFALIVLDTGEIAPRLTLAATFRFRLAVQRADTALVILARHRIAGAAATVAIETTRETVEWSGLGPRPARLAAMRSGLHVLRPSCAAHSRTPLVVPEMTWEA